MFCVLENISPKKRLSGISPGGKKQTVSYSIGRPGRSPWIGLCTHPLDVRPAPRGGVFWGWFESNSCCDVGTDSWGLACPTQPFQTGESFSLNLFEAFHVCILFSFLFCSPLLFSSLLSSPLLSSLFSLSSSRLSPSLLFSSHPKTTTWHG